MLGSKVIYGVRLSLDGAEKEPQGPTPNVRGRRPRGYHRRLPLPVYDTARGCGDGCRDFLRLYAASLLWVRIASSSLSGIFSARDSRIRRSKSAAGNGRLK